MARGWGRTKKKKAKKTPKGQGPGGRTSHTDEGGVAGSGAGRQGRDGGRWRRRRDGSSAADHTAPGRRRAPPSGGRPPPQCRGGRRAARPGSSRARGSGQERTHTTPRLDTKRHTPPRPPRRSPFPPRELAEFPAGGAPFLRRRRRRRRRAPAPRDAPPGAGRAAGGGGGGPGRRASGGDHQLHCRRVAGRGGHATRTPAARLFGLWGGAPPTPQRRAAARGGRWQRGGHGSRNRATAAPSGGVLCRDYPIPPGGGSQRCRRGSGRRQAAGSWGPAQRRQRQTTRRRRRVAPRVEGPPRRGLPAAAATNQYVGSDTVQCTRAVGHTAHPADAVCGKAAADRAEIRSSGRRRPTTGAAEAGGVAGAAWGHTSRRDYGAPAAE